MAEEKDSSLRHIVRICRTDLDGSLPIAHALTSIKGIGFSLASAVCTVAKVPKVSTLGLLPQSDIDKIDVIISDPVHHGVPSWLLNRRKDFESGDDKHLVGSDLSYRNENDIKFLRKIRTNKGFRHAVGLPVRGQRTRSNFRRNKGKAVGVKKTAEQR